MADILIVDDDRDVAAPLEEFLRTEGHVVRCALGGLDGLLQVAARIPELILLDVDMPVMTGPEMSMELLERNRGQERIPVILLSGVADLPRVAREVGTPYYLGKPYHLDQLVRVLDRVLKERTPPVRRKRAG